MATSGPTNLSAFFNVDADFRNWAAGIHTALTAMGLVNTADTGQINTATVTKPAGVGQIGGYEIWRFADTLQATVPVFLKIEYGAGFTSAGRPAIYLTVGSGSNGSGTLTGQLSTRQGLGSNVTGGAGDVLPMYCSGGTNALFLALNLDTGTLNKGIMCVVERTKDSTGTDTADGVLVTFASGIDCIIGNPNYIGCQFLPATGAVPPVVTNSTTNALLPSVSPEYFRKGISGSNALVMPLLIPVSGAWLFSKMLVIGASDFGALGTFTTTIFGASHTFLALGQAAGNNSPVSAGAGTSGTSTLNGLAMAWE